MFHYSPMKHITLLITAIVSLLVVTSCTTAQKDASKKYAIQIGQEVAKSAGIAAATIATDLTQLKLTEADQKLDAQIAALDPVKDATKIASLKLQKVATAQAHGLRGKAEAQIVKLRTVDTLPAPEPVVQPVP